MRRGLIAVVLLLLASSVGCQTQTMREPPPARAAIVRSLESAPAPRAFEATTNVTADVTTNALATAAETPAGLWVRVADVGQALCVIGVTRDGYTFLIDAGHWNGGRCAAALEELVPDGGGLSLVVLTHSDSDHLGDLPEILERDVDTILWTGRVPPACRRGGGAGCASAYKAAARAIGKAAGRGSTVINLKTTAMTPGEIFELGDVEIMFLAGWHDFPDVAGLSPAERENVISIMVRISYGGNSMIVTGDAIGRPLDGPADACRASEAWAVGNLDADWLSADVLVASHHGGDNGSANCFISAVAPRYVVFAAGTQHEHPRQTTAERFLRLGVPAERLLRTDRGSKSERHEWVDGIIARCGDVAGDDSIDILFTAGQPLDIGYVAEDRCARL